MSEVKVRQSNMELLRILAMFLVLLYHCVFLENGYPSTTDAVGSPLTTFCNLFLYAGSAVCVNVFVLLSGWFGIHPTKKGFLSFAFMVIFYFVVCYAVGLTIGTIPLKGSTLFDFFTLSTEYWFVYAYAGLYLMAPILNAYIAHATSAQLRHTILLFYLLQTWYGWFRPEEAQFFMGGHSTMSFIGLYLLARYLNLYWPRFKRSPARSFAGYGCVVLLSAGVAFFALYNNVSINYVLSLFFYVSPLNLLSSVLLFRGFVALSMPHKPWVNRLALSAFAVYLIHANEVVFVYLKDAVNALCVLSLSYPLYLLALFLLLVVVYLLCYLFDQLRQLCWQMLVRYFG